MKTFLTVIVSFLLSMSAWAEAGKQPKRQPFASKDQLLQVLFDAGFSRVFEFKANSNFAIYSPSQNAQQEGEVRKTTVGFHASSEGVDWERIPALDYELRSAGIGRVNIFGYKVGTKRFEAYKVGGFAICHRVEDGFVFDTTQSRHQKNFSSCIAVPMDVNEVIERLELRGYLK